MAWDPLDGSSILGAGWAVGAIFGVWPGGQLLGRSGSELAAAAYAVFGPRTLLVLARPCSGGARPQWGGTCRKQVMHCLMFQVRSGLRYRRSTHDNDIVPSCGRQS